MSSKAEILKILPKFKEKFFYTADKKPQPYGLQRKCTRVPPNVNPGVFVGKVDYHTFEEGSTTDQLLLNHFGQKPLPSTYYDYASLAVRWKDKPSVKWICLDFDHDWQIPLRDKVLAQLSTYGIECLWETGRWEGDHQRSHNWFMLDNVDNQTIEKFLLQVWSDLRAQGVEMKETKDWEFYPVFTKQKCLMRIPGGYHFKAGGVTGVLVDGEVVTDPVGIMQAFLDLPVYSNEFIQSLLRAPAPGTIEARPEKRKYERFLYISREMPAPMPDLPRFVEVIAQDCQAYRKLIVDAVNNDLIDKAGINHHNSGLVLAKLSRFASYAAESFPGLCENERVEKGEEWWETLATEYRSRGYEDHQWKKRPGEKPNTNVWKCSTMEKYFNLCEGCPHMKRMGFDSPKQLFFGKRVQKVKVGEVFKES